jgi:ABC-2 type transport system permease protein
MATPEQPRPSGAIYDLGFRHHDGPRLGRPAITRALALESARGGYGLGRAGRAKVMPLLLLGLVCLPAFIVAVVAALTKLDQLPGGYSGYLFRVQPLVMIYLASTAPAMVSRDLRFRVVSLYFSRPMERRDYVAAKYVAMTADVFVFCALPLTILFVGALLAQMSVRDQARDYLRGLATALVLALVLAAIGLLIAALTPRRGFGVAVIVAVLAILAAVHGIVAVHAFEHGKTALQGYSGLISPFSLADGIGRSVLGADSPLDVGPPGRTGGLVFVLVAVALVAACLGLLLRRYRSVVT